MKCANCGTKSTGRFCPSCGAAMEVASCPECGAKLVPGSRFCTQCGAKVDDADAPARGARRTAAAGRAGRGSPARAGRPGDGGGSSNLPWYIAAGVLVVIIIVLLVPMITGGGNSSPAGTGGFPLGQGAGTAPGSPPPLTGTPREQADRLFNRIMAARERGDMAEAQQFTPMAISAYNSVDLDDDGLYHLAMVYIVAGQHDQAIATAERILARNPNHLLALAAAGEAATLAANDAAARGYYGRFLDAYDTEIGRALPEYQDHAGVFDEYRTTARRATGR